MTPEQMIAELDKDASEWDGAVIAVGFPESSILIEPHDPRRLEALTSALSKKGTPLGVVVANFDTSKLPIVQMTSTCRSFPGAEEYRHILVRLMQQVAAMLVQQNGGRIVSDGSPN